MLEEKRIIDKIEIIGDIIQVREKVSILKDGVEIASNYHRRAYDKSDEMSSEDPKIISVAKAIWPEKFLTSDDVSNIIEPVQEPQITPTELTEEGQ